MLIIEEMQKRMIILWERVSLSKAKRDHPAVDCYIPKLLYKIERSPIIEPI